LIGVRLGKLNATPLKLPAITDAASIASALAVITGKIAAGELDLNAANSLIALLETHRKAIETVELEARIERLEAAKGMLPRIEERDEPEDG
jgi:DNA-directed RNA polymerase subunit H (RpoH/RPB5)